MQVSQRVLSPTSFDRSAMLRPPAVPASAPPPQPVLETLTTQVQDTLSLGNLSAPARSSVGELNQALQTLQQLTQSGPNASTQEVLTRFQQETLPLNLAQLEQSQQALQSQLASLPPESPDRASLQTQLQSVGLSIDLYRQASVLLAQSPLLAAPPSLPAFDVATGLSAAIIPAQTRESYRPSTYDIFEKTPNSDQTIFNQRRDAIQEQMGLLDQALEQERDPVQRETLSKTRALLQNLSDLYASIPSYTGIGQRGVENDVQAFSSRIAAATEALTALAPELDKESLTAIQGQLRDLTTAASSILTLPGRPGNLGYSLNITYKRLGEIQIAKRSRPNETADIAGALQSYANDRSDMAIFVQRLGSLRDDIRSGRISGVAARERALQSIPGTSAAFRTAYTQLVDAELALVEAARRQEAAAAAAARGRENVATAEGQVTQAETANAAGQQAQQSAQALAAQGNYGAAQPQNQTARRYQQLGATQLAAAQGSSQSARNEFNLAERELQQANGLTAQALRNADAADASAYGDDLSDGIAGVRGRAGQIQARSGEVSAEVNALQGQLTALDARISATGAANQSLSGEITATAQDISEGLEAQRRREAQNSQELDKLRQFFTQRGSKFELQLMFGLKAGKSLNDNLALEGSASIVARLIGEVEPSGAVKLNYTFGGEGAATLKAWLFSVEGKARFETMGGVRLASPAQAQHFAQLLDNVSKSVGTYGITSSEAAAARDEFLQFLEDTERSGTVRSLEIGASRGSGADKRGGSGKVTVEDILTRNFNDRNGNGERDPGEERIEERTRLRIGELAYTHGDNKYAITARDLRNDRGQLLSRTYDIVLPNNGALNPQALTQGLQPLLAEGGFDGVKLDAEAIEEKAKRAKWNDPKRRQDDIVSVRVTEKPNGEQSYNLVVTRRDSLEVSGEVTFTPTVTGTASLKGTVENSQIIA
jgi:hypothetical protein